MKGIFQFPEACYRGHNFVEAVEIIRTWYIVITRQYNGIWIYKYFPWLTQIIFCSYGCLFWQWHFFALLNYTANKQHTLQSFKRGQRATIVSVKEKLFIGPFKLKKISNIFFQIWNEKQKIILSMNVWKIIAKHDNRPYRLWTRFRIRYSYRSR